MGDRVQVKVLEQENDDGKDVEESVERVHLPGEDTAVYHLGANMFVTIFGHIDSTSLTRKYFPRQVLRHELSY